MNKHQPLRFQASLEVQDGNGMIPLHRAALFNFSDVAKFLIDHVSMIKVLPDISAEKNKTDKVPAGVK